MFQKVNFMSQRHQKLPGCIVSLSTDAITIITLLGLVYSMTSVKNVHAVQRKQSTKHCHDLTRSRRVRNIHCHAEERRWACPAKRSKDEVFRKCPLSGCGFFFFFYRASHSTIQRCQRMSRNSHSHSNFVRLQVWFLAVSSWVRG